MTTILPSLPTWVVLYTVDEDPEELCSVRLPAVTGEAALADFEATMPRATAWGVKPAEGDQDGR